jgi:4-hydroxybenzoate polyprenyltransferase
MIKKIIGILEAQSIVRSFVFVVSWIFLRNFFEGVLGNFQRIGFISFSYRSVLMYSVHFPLFYLSLFIFLVILLTFITKESIARVTGIASYGFMLIIFIPLIDKCLGGYLLTYPLRIAPYLYNFLNPFIDLGNIGVSPGQRIIIVCIAILIAVYVYIKTRSIAKSLLAALCGFVIIVFWGGLTTLLARNRPENYFLSGGFLYYDTQKFSAVYGLLLLPLCFIFWYLLDKKNFARILESMRLERMFLFGGMGIFGYLLAKHQVPMMHINTFDPLAIALVFLILSLGFWTIQVINDFFDIKSDRIARKRNPLLEDGLRRYYAVWGITLAIFVLIYSLIVNYTTFLIMVTFILLGIIYSVPPIRLKRIPFISTFILALAVVLAVSVGFSLFFGGKALHMIPTPFLLATFIGVTLGFTAKDIHDRDADKQDHVYTLAVLFYKKDQWSQRLPMAFIIGFSYLVYAFFIPQILLGAVVWSLMTFSITLFVKKPKEWVYFLFVYTFGFYLFYIITQ